MSTSEFLSESRISVDIASLRLSSVSLVRPSGVWMLHLLSMLECLDRALILRAASWHVNRRRDIQGSFCQFPVHIANACVISKIKSWRKQLMSGPYRSMKLGWNALILEEELPIWLVHVELLKTLPTPCDLNAASSPHIQGLSCHIHKMTRGCFAWRILKTADLTSTFDVSSSFMLGLMNGSESKMLIPPRRPVIMCSTSLRTLRVGEPSATAFKPFLNGWLLAGC